jgi:hypothetical protein
MRVSGLGWLLKTSLTNTLSSLRKFCLAVTLCKKSADLGFRLAFKKLSTPACWRGYFLAHPSIIFAVCYLEER